MMKQALRFLRNKHSGIMLRIRGLYWAQVFGAFDRSSKILGKISVLEPDKIFVGKHSRINEGCFLNAKDEIRIGNYVHISPFTIINTGGLCYTGSRKDRQHIRQPVVLEDGVWVGSGVLINPGVTIGYDAVVGAGAVVTKDIPPNVVAVGVPARVIKEIERGQEKGSSSSQRGVAA